jgi:hypothetical protein
MRHESIAYYEPDVTVSDADDPPIRSTPQTEQFDMQVMLDDGFFHREMDYLTSACDQPIPHFGNWKRVQRLQGNLCPICYTPAELARAAATNAAEREQEAADRKPLHRTGEYEKSASDWIAEPTKPRTKTKPNGSK